MYLQEYVYRGRNRHKSCEGTVKKGKYKRRCKNIAMISGRCKTCLYKNEQER